MLIKFLLQHPKFIRSELADGYLVKFSKDRIDLTEKMKRKAITPSFFSHAPDPRYTFGTAKADALLIVQIQRSCDGRYFLSSIIAGMSVSPSFLVRYHSQVTIKSHFLFLQLFLKRQWLVQRSPKWGSIRWLFSGGVLMTGMSFIFYMPSF